MELSLLILVCIHKSYIVYLEIYLVPIGHGFSFFGHGNVMENQCWKRGGTLILVPVEVSKFWGVTDGAVLYVLICLTTYCYNVWSKCDTSTVFPKCAKIEDTSFWLKPLDVVQQIKEFSCLIVVASCHSFISCRFTTIFTANINIFNFVLISPFTFQQLLLHMRLGPPKCLPYIASSLYRPDAFLRVRRMNIVRQWWHVVYVRS